VLKGCGIYIKVIATNAYGDSPIMVHTMTVADLKPEDYKKLRTFINQIALEHNMFLAVLVVLVFAQIFIIVPS